MDATRLIEKIVNGTIFLKNSGIIYNSEKIIEKLYEGVMESQLSTSLKELEMNK